MTDNWVLQFDSHVNYLPFVVGYQKHNWKGSHALRMLRTKGKSATMWSQNALEENLLGIQMLIKHSNNTWMTHGPDVEVHPWWLESYSVLAASIVPFTL